MVLGFSALVFLAFQVSGLTYYSDQDTYQVIAHFQNIGDLKKKAPVRMAGVKVGSVRSISLDPKSYFAKVTVDIEKQYTQIPIDSSLSILTEGLLGSNYLSLEAGGEVEYLHNGDMIEDTSSALILEHLIGKFLVNSAESKADDKEQ